MDSLALRLDHEGLQTARWSKVGDKSPKAKERAKKQDAADKNQKKAAAQAKASQQGPASAGKKGR